MLKISFLILTLVLVGNCSDNSTKRINEKILEKTVDLGKMTKKDIEMLFGKPNEINRDTKENIEYWNYQVQDNNSSLFDFNKQAENFHKIIQFSFNNDSLVMNYTILKAIKDEKWSKPPSGSLFKYRFKN
ncbi:MAG: hypothetical protein J0H68_09530 [Sphingobacteriia bacterium]|nr:hypothetical protein [Sphingobacteriia bacterium]